MTTKLIRALERQIEDARRLKERVADRPNFEGWKTQTEMLIQRATGDDSIALDKFQELTFTRAVPVARLRDETIRPSEQERRQIQESAYQSDLDAAIGIIEAVIEILQFQTGSAPAIGSRPEVSRRVFVVHGHDEEAKQSVARCLEKLGLEANILHEQPNQGRTIIEKFEDYADVGFAVVLLTPDDMGAAKDETDNLRPRARQNVVFELGFFVGKLGRQRVCALHKGDVEIPSDFAGVLWVPMDPEGVWRFTLGREMKAAGLDVDLNKLA